MIHPLFLAAGTHLCLPYFRSPSLQFCVWSSQERWALSSNWSQPYILHTPRSLSQWAVRVKTEKKLGSSVASWDSSCDSVLLIGFHIPGHLGSISQTLATLHQFLSMRIFHLRSSEEITVCGKSWSEMDKGRNTFGLSGCFSVTFLDCVCVCIYVDIYTVCVYIF